MWLNANPQLDKKGQLHHLLTLEGLPAEILWQILDTANVILMVVTYMNATVANSRSAIDTFEALGYKGRKPILLVVIRLTPRAGCRRPPSSTRSTCRSSARSRPTGRR